MDGVWQGSERTKKVFRCDEKLLAGDLSRFAYDAVLALLQCFRFLLVCIHMMSKYPFRFLFVLLVDAFVNFEVFAHADDVAL